MAASAVRISAAAAGGAKLPGCTDNWWPSNSPQGHIIGYLGTLTDITEHKQFEEALQKSNAQNRNILSLIPDYLFRIDSDGK